MYCKVLMKIEVSKTIHTVTGSWSKQFIQLQFFVTQTHAQSMNVGFKWTKSIEHQCTESTIKIMNLSSSELCFGLCVMSMLPSYAPLPST